MFQLESYKKRDKNKLYSNFKKGKIKNIVGLDIKADFPVNPDIEIKNYNNETGKVSKKKFLKYHKNFLRKYNMHKKNY